MRLDALAPFAPFLRRWPLFGLAALLLLIALAALPTGASAQTPVVLISNTYQANAGGGTAGFDHAQAFTTGSHVRGYKLTSVGVYLTASPTNSHTEWDMQIWSDTASSPGSVLYALTKPASVSTGVNHFVAAGGGMDLAPNTTYWVVWDNHTNAHANEMGIQNTTQNIDPYAAAGWSLGDGAYRPHSSTGSWSSWPRRKISVSGYVKPLAGPDGCDTCPDVPTVYAEPGFRGEITVNWTPATTGPAATSWQIRYAKDTGEVDNPFNNPRNVSALGFSASTRSHTISGLEPGVQYAVLIMGENRNGKGDATVVSLAAGTLPLPGPPFHNATVFGDILRVGISGSLDTGSKPLGSAFTVTASQYGSVRTISGSDVAKRGLDPVRMSSRIRYTFVYVLLTESVRRGETVTVSYTRPTQNPLQDRSGNRHTYSFSNKPVANHTRRDSSDKTPPTFASAKVEKPDDRFALTETTLLVTFNEKLDLESADTAGSAFSVTVTNPVTNAERTINGKGTVRTGERNDLGYLVPNSVAYVTLDGRIRRGETVTVSYVEPMNPPSDDDPPPPP